MAVAVGLSASFSAVLPRGRESEREREGMHVCFDVAETAPSPARYVHCNAPPTPASVLPSFLPAAACQHAIAMGPWHGAIERAPRPPAAALLRQESEEKAAPFPPPPRVAPHGRGRRLVSCHGKPEGGRGGREEVCGGGIEPRLSDIAGRSPARQPPSSPLVSSAWENRCIKCPRKEGVGRVLQNRKSIITLRWSHVRESAWGFLGPNCYAAGKSVGLSVWERGREGGRKVSGRKRPASSLLSLPPSLPLL